MLLSAQLQSILLARAPLTVQMKVGLGPQLSVVHTRASLRPVPSDMVSSLGGAGATPDAMESGQNLCTGLFCAVFFFVFGVSEQLESNMGCRIRLLALMNLHVDKGKLRPGWPF